MKVRGKKRVSDRVRVRVKVKVRVKVRVKARVRHTAGAMYVFKLTFIGKSIKYTGVCIGIGT